MTYIIYNKLAGNRRGEERSKEVLKYVKDEYKFIEISTIDSYSDFFNSLNVNDSVIICGGDGTLNRFVNDYDGELPENEILYYGIGSGNDFLHDLGVSEGYSPIFIKPYLENLPTIEVNGMKKKFINGIGYGIDGYCCEEGDRIRESSDKEINYTNIAIKGLLYAYKRTNATLIVDGKEYKFKHVFLAPTMNGRFFGGGMMPIPSRDRSDSSCVEVMVYHSLSKLKTLIIFPSFFEGKHISHDKNVQLFKGKEITVKFDRPTPLQIDGETVKNVTEYTVHAACIK